MAKEWKNVIKTTDGQEYVDPCVLSSGPRSTCKAIFFIDLIDAKPFISPHKCL